MTFALCSMPLLIAAETPPVVGSPDWLVGTWVPGGESCESDAGVLYDRDGSWSSYGETGKWTLQDGTITAEIVERSDDSGELQKLDAPEVHRQTIEVSGPDKYTSRWADGTVEHFTRCPALDQ